MTRRAWFCGLLVVLLVSVVAPGALPARAQVTDGLVVLALESAREPVEAWAAAYASVTEGRAALQLEFASTAAEVAARANEAAVIVTDAYEEIPPITFECGYISDVFLLLPGLGARYLASNSCGGTLDPRDALARDFLRFVTGPDGQQIAIDLGLLPAAIEIVDQSGATVRVPQPVRRIASPYSIATYYVYGVGAADRLVVAGYLGARDPEGKAGMLKLDPNFEAIANAVSTLNQQEANIEELAALKPDLILASTRTGWLDAAAALGVPILRFEGESPQALQDAMSLLGAVLGPQAEVLLLDEPTAHLDPRNQHRVLETVSQLAGQDVSFVISSHNPNSALLYVHHVIVMKAGRIVADGRPPEVLTEPVLSTAYEMAVEVITNGANAARAIMPRRLNGN